MNVYATLKPDSPRRADWMEAFGTDRIRLNSATSRVVKMPGSGLLTICFAANLYALDEGQRGRLKRFVADRFCDGDAVRAAKLLYSQHGMPILDGPDLGVTIEAEAYL